MKKNHNYFVYILVSNSGTLYILVTNNLERKIYEHKIGLVEGFTKKYNCNKLIYFENGGDVNGAIIREKQLIGVLSDSKRDSSDKSSKMTKK